MPMDGVSNSNISEAGGHWDPHIPGSHRTRRSASWSASLKVAASAARKYSLLCPVSGFLLGKGGNFRRIWKKGNFLQRFG